MDGLIAAARILASFVLGSIPFAKVAMIGTGIDITKAGSKNPGFNNVLRVCREAGIASKNLRGAFALIGDIGKGFLALSLFSRGLTSPRPNARSPSERWLVGSPSSSCGRPSLSLHMPARSRARCSDKGEG